MCIYYKHLVYIFHNNMFVYMWQIFYSMCVMLDSGVISDFFILIVYAEKLFPPQLQNYNFYDVIYPLDALNDMLLLKTYGTVDFTIKKSLLI